MGKRKNTSSANGEPKRRGRPPNKRPKAEEEEESEASSDSVEQEETVNDKKEGNKSGDFIPTLLPNRLRDRTSTIDYRDTLRPRRAASSDSDSEREPFKLQKRPENRKQEEDDSEESDDGAERLCRKRVPKTKRTVAGARCAFLLKDSEPNTEEESEHPSDEEETPPEEDTAAILAELEQLPDAVTERFHDCVKPMLRYKRKGIRVYKRIVETLHLELGVERRLIIAWFKNEKRKMKEKEMSGGSLYKKRNLSREEEEKKRLNAIAEMRKIMLVDNIKFWHNQRKLEFMQRHQISGHQLDRWQNRIRREDRVPFYEAGHIARLEDYSRIGLRGTPFIDPDNYVGPAGRLAVVSDGRITTNYAKTGWEAIQSAPQQPTPPAPPTDGSRIPWFGTSRPVGPTEVYRQPSQHESHPKPTGSLGPSGPVQNGQPRGSERSPTPPTQAGSSGTSNWQPRQQIPSIGSSEALRPAQIGQPKGSTISSSTNRSQNGPSVTSSCQPKEQGPSLGSSGASRTPQIAHALTTAPQRPTPPTPSTDGSRIVWFGTSGLFGPNSVYRQHSTIPESSGSSRPAGPTTPRPDQRPTLQTPSMNGSQNVSSGASRPVGSSVVYRQPSQHSTIPKSSGSSGPAGPTTPRPDQRPTLQTPSMNGSQIVSSGASRPVGSSVVYRQPSQHSTIPKSSGSSGPAGPTTPRPDQRPTLQTPSMNGSQNVSSGASRPVRPTVVYRQSSQQGTVPKTSGLSGLAGPTPRIYQRPTYPIPSTNGSQVGLSGASRPVVISAYRQSSQQTSYPKPTESTVPSTSVLNGQPRGSAVSPAPPTQAGPSGMSRIEPQWRPKPAQLPTYPTLSMNGSQLISSGAPRSVGISAAYRQPIQHGSTPKLTGLLGPSGPVQNGQLRESVRPATPPTQAALPATSRLEPEWRPKPAQLPTYPTLSMNGSQFVSSGASSSAYRQPIQHGSLPKLTGSLGPSRPVQNGQPRESVRSATPPTQAAPPGTSRLEPEWRPRPAQSLTYSNTSTSRSRYGWSGTSTPATTPLPVVKSEPPSVFKTPLKRTTFTAPIPPSDLRTTQSEVSGVPPPARTLGFAAEARSRRDESLRRSVSAAPGEKGNRFSAYTKRRALRRREQVATVRYDSEESGGLEDIEEEVVTSGVEQEENPVYEQTMKYGPSTSGPAPQAPANTLPTPAFVTRPASESSQPPVGSRMLVPSPSAPPSSPNLPSTVRKTPAVPATAAAPKQHASGQPAFKTPAVPTATPHRPSLSEGSALSSQSPGISQEEEEEPFKKEVRHVFHSLKIKIFNNARKEDICRRYNISLDTLTNFLAPMRKQDLQAFILSRKGRCNEYMAGIVPDTFVRTPVAQTAQKPAQYEYPADEEPMEFD